MKLAKKLCCLLACLLLSACGTASADNPTNDTCENSTHEIYMEQSVQEHLDSDTYELLVQDHPNYQVYSNENLHGYYYRIIDNCGKLLDEGFLTWRFLNIELVEPNIVEIRTGSGGALSSSKFFDCENRRVSAIYPHYLAVSGDLIVYFETNGQSIQLRIQNIFDKRQYDYVIEDDSFSTMVLTETTGTATFSADKQTITVVYPDSQGNSTSKEFQLP